MRKSIFKSSCPADSQLRSFMSQIDFEDAYAFLGSGNSGSMEEVYARIFNTTPAWITYAMRMRNILVSPLGLKTEIDSNRIPSLQEGKKAGIFNIYKILEHEVIAGEDDKHLNFRVSVHRNRPNDSTITITTIVHYNNLLGKIYMTLISPFHKMVVKSILKSAVSRFNGH